MAKRQEIDWPKAEVFYHQGFSASEIAAEVGCSVAAVRSRIHRDRWSVKKTQIATKLHSVAYKSAANAIRSNAERFVAQMEEDIDRTMLTMAEVPPVPDLGMLEKRESVLEKLNKRARSTFGLDAQTGPSVQIAFFNSPVSESQTIEVQSVVPEKPE